MGWAVAAPIITNAIRKVHDFLTVGAPAPLQEAGAAALGLAKATIRVSRQAIVSGATDSCLHCPQAGFRCFRPRGAYYVMTDISGFGFEDDLSFVKHLVQKVGVAAVPGSSFYHHPRDGARQVRFAFCKRADTLDEAGKRLRRIKTC